MSFALTEEALLVSAAHVDAGGDGQVAGGKWVTRRVGWANLKVGDRVSAVRKAMGLKRGEKAVVLCVIEVVSVRRERLDFIRQADCIAEGFSHHTPKQFVEMFGRHMSITHPDEGVWSSEEQCWKRRPRPVRPDDQVTRIEFRVVPGSRQVATQERLAI